MAGLNVGELYAKLTGESDSLRKHVSGKSSGDDSEHDTEKDQKSL